jgi:hypothetical protein
MEESGMVISVTSEIEAALAEQARRQGTTPELLALDCLRQHFLSPTATEGTGQKTETLADFLAGHIGVLSSSEHVPGGARMSERSTNRGRADKPTCL